MAFLDHIVVNTLLGMEGAAATFAALGFTLTPLGRHSLGSINHLMMTPGAYFELVGVPETGLQRQEVLDSPFGLNGLVFKSTDAETTFARLTKRGLPALPPTSFSRPVEIDGSSQDARFLTVRLGADAFPAGRVYFCEHLTPELVWRPEWLGHQNGFAAMDELIIASPNAAGEAHRYAVICDAEAMASGDAWIVALDGFRLKLIQAENARFVSLGLRFAHLEELERRAIALPGVTWRRQTPDAAELVVSALDLHLDCRSAG